MGTYLRVWLLCISSESPSNILLDGTSLNFVDSVLTKLYVSEKGTNGLYLKWAFYVFYL